MGWVGRVYLPRQLLSWTGDDGYEPGGRRVAGVMWVYEPMVGVIGPGHDGGTGVVPYWGWAAYVSRDGQFEELEENGVLGRWKTREAAQAAANRAYYAWLTTSAPHAEVIQVAADARAGETGAPPRPGWIARARTSLGINARGVKSLFLLAFRPRPPRILRRR